MLWNQTCENLDDSGKEKWPDCIASVDSPKGRVKKHNWKNHVSLLNGCINECNLIKETTKSPNICFGSYMQTRVEINHFRGPIKTNQIWTEKNWQMKTCRTELYTSWFPHLWPVPQNPVTSQFICYKKHQYTSGLSTLAVADPKSQRT